VSGAESFYFKFYYTYALSNFTCKCKYCC
jgi:hypothetical protein